VIDGELYIHGSRLQKIGSLVKRKQKESRMLKYHCYDMVSELSFAQRYDLLKTYHLGGNALLAPTWSAARDFDVENDLIIAKESGYEGLMLRVDGTGYEDGRRSKSLLKVKSVQDDEYTVVQITSSKDNWAILHCELPDGGRFSVTAPGAVFEKEYVLKNARAFIGKQVTVEYAMLTEDGKPFHPVATQWRNKNDE
jgi:ATP-dependent DNA ligase